MEVVMINKTGSDFSSVPSHNTPPQKETIHEVDDLKSKISNKAKQILMDNKVEDDLDITNFLSKGSAVSREKADKQVHQMAKDYASIEEKDSNSITALKQGITEVRSDLGIHRKNITDSHIVIKGFKEGCALAALVKDGRLNNYHQDIQNNGVNAADVQSLAQILGKIKPAEAADQPGSALFPKNMFNNTPLFQVKEVILIDDDENPDDVDLDTIDPSNRLRLRSMTDEEEEEVKTLLTNYFETYFLLHQLETQLQTLMDKQQKPEAISSDKEKQITITPHQAHREEKSSSKSAAAEYLADTDEKIIKQEESLKGDIAQAQQRASLRKSGEKRKEQIKEAKEKVYENKLDNRERITNEANKAAKDHRDAKDKFEKKPGKAA